MMTESPWVRFEQKEVFPTNKKAKKSLVERRKYISCACCMLLSAMNIIFIGKSPQAWSWC